VAPMKRLTVLLIVGASSLCNALRLPRVARPNVAVAPTAEPPSGILSLAPNIASAAAVVAAVVAKPLPALAAAKKAVPFTLLGKTSSELFAVQNLSLVSWLLMILLPRWKMTPPLVLVAPLVFSALYGSVLLHMIKHPAPGITVSFSSLEGIMPGFTLPDGAFAGWLHYCTFDPLVGLGIVLDAKRNGIPHLLCVPCLVATLFAGPVGFASYMLLRTVLKAFKKSPVPPPKGFEWGKTL